MSTEETPIPDAACYDVAGRALASFICGRRIHSLECTEHRTRVAADGVELPFIAESVVFHSGAMSRLIFDFPVIGDSDEPLPTEDDHEAFIIFCEGRGVDPIAFLPKALRLTHSMLLPYRACIAAVARSLKKLGTLNGDTVEIFFIERGIRQMDRSEFTLSNEV